jgi:hypothetical protein
MAEVNVYRINEENSYFYGEGYQYLFRILSSMTLRKKNQHSINTLSTAKKYGFVL